MKPPPNPFRLYWRDYGGFSSLLKSGYFRWSVLLTGLCFPLWRQSGWWDVVTTVIPSLLGFSLAAYAMLIAFGNEKFLHLMTTPRELQENEEGNGERKTMPSVYLTTSAAFVHYMVVQTVALVSALLAQSWHIPIDSRVKHLLYVAGLSENLFIQVTQLLWIPAFFTFVYGLLCGVAATMRVYRMTRWYATLVQAQKNPD